MAITTCALYGTTTYANSWIGINVMVLLLSLIIVAVVYIISNILPIITRQKLVSAARSEITQIIISAVILSILLGLAVTACNISASFTKNLIPSTFSAMNPFQYADYFVGNLSLNTGLNLLTNIYSTSVSYAIEGQVLESIGKLFNSAFSGAFGILRNIFSGSTSAGQGIFSVGIALGVQLGAVFSTLSTVYMALSVPVTLAVGLLFILFLVIPVLQYTAFTIILPIALAMRTFSFLGVSLKSASNAMLAFAIAAYIIFPLMIAFNGYAVSWIFSAQNPSYQYLHSTYLVPGTKASTYFTTNPSSTAPSALISTISNTLGQPIGQTASLVFSSFATTGVLYSPQQVTAQARVLIDEIAQFIFVAVILTVIDLAITIGFASGLAKALNGGVEGAGSFWSGV
ncbi:MAG: hypothetical protein ABSE71_05430 [Candidatus Micrarchaeaceae archaeon]|jgi:hypothetical protein